MIEVGEYIRHKKGYIHKAKSVYKDMIWWCDLSWIAEKDIVKHSKNIIDLIEVRRFYNIMQRRLSRISNKYWFR